MASNNPVQTIAATSRFTQERCLTDAYVAQFSSGPFTYSGTEMQFGPDLEQIENEAFRQKYDSSAETPRIRRALLFVNSKGDTTLSVRHWPKGLFEMSFTRVLSEEGPEHIVEYLVKNVNMETTRFLTAARETVDEAPARFLMFGDNAMVQDYDITAPKVKKDPRRAVSAQIRAAALKLHTAARVCGF